MAALTWPASVAELGYVRQCCPSSVKRLLELTNEDLIRTPIWRYEGTSDDNAVVSPASSLESADERAYIARTRFTFADGSQGWGYCSPTDGSGLDYVQPVLITPAGCHVHLWREESADAAELRRASEQSLAFPVHFECVVAFEGHLLCGTGNDFVAAPPNHALQPTAGALGVPGEFRLDLRPGGG